MSGKPQPGMKTRISPARRVAYAGLVAALSIVLLYLLNMLTTLTLAILFVLSFLPVTLAYEKRYLDALLCYVASALISSLMLPLTGPWLLYVSFFGWYGVAREFVVTRCPRAVSWAVLAVLFNIVFFALYFLFQSLVALFTVPEWLKSVPLPLLLIPAAEAAFVLFELLFGMCRAYYIQRVRKLLFK